MVHFVHCHILSVRAIGAIAARREARPFTLTVNLADVRDER
jgi:hypothetical protein